MLRLASQNPSNSSLLALLSLLLAHPGSSIDNLQACHALSVL